MPEIKPGTEYSATIVKGTDPSQKGMYMVHIPELMPHMPEDKGWLVKNHAHNWRLHKTPVGVAGQYFPIHAGANVIVKFYQEDENTGYIDRVISDGGEKSDLAPPLFDSAKSSPNDRDEQYVLAATPKYKTVIYINEDSSTNSNTLYIIHNDKKSIIKMDSTGLNVASEVDVTIEATANVNITGRALVNICGSSSIKMDGGTIDMNSGSFAGGKAVDKS